MITIADADDHHRQRQHRQRRQGVADVEDLHHVFRPAAGERAAQQDTAGNTDQQRQQHGAGHQEHVLLAEVDQIFPARLEGVPTDAVNQQCDDGDKQQAPEEQAPVWR
jgi:hypothetical protein